MEKLRAGICGLGGLGRAHASNIVNFPDVELVSVCDIDKAKLEPQEIKTNLDLKLTPFDIRKCRTYTDMAKMLADEKLDILVTALPTDLHAEIAIQAMEAGCHVFSEKPMALSYRESKKMIKAAKKNKRQLMVGQCLRFWPEYMKLLEAVEKKTYGRLLSLTMTRIGGYSSWGGSWFNNHKQSGGAILDLHLHDVDWVWHALGKPTTIFASGLQGKTGGIDDVTAVWEYKDCNVTIRGSWMYQGFCMNFQAFFEDAAIDYGISPEMPFRLLSRKNAKGEAIPFQADSAYVQELRYFCDCVKGVHPNTLCTPESTAESIRFVEKELKSIKKGKPVKIN